MYAIVSGTSEVVFKNVASAEFIPGIKKTNAANNELALPLTFGNKDNAIAKLLGKIMPLIILK